MGVHVHCGPLECRRTALIVYFIIQCLFPSPPLPSPPLPSPQMNEHGVTHNELEEKLKQKEQSFDRLSAEKAAHEWELNESRQQLREFSEQLSAKEEAIMRLVSWDWKRGLCTHHPCSCCIW